MVRLLWDWLFTLSKSDVIAIVNIVCTILIAIFVQKATSKSADAAVRTAELTEESIKLSKLVHELQQKEVINHKNALKVQNSIVLLKRSNEVLMAITHHDSWTIQNNLKQIKTELEMESEELAKTFTAEEVFIIFNAWEILKEYVDKYYIKGVYFGVEENRLAEKAPKVIEAFTEVKELMTKIIGELSL
ncbi:hypothetical protein [Paenibacillus ihumii]|uniref:hypothetical protein n=1 Tax=Paenibacillus ihumii TaxID=687436 RepID=UPI0006D76B3C|nr:hypothetical protein [Paenibacillus ihumii]